MDTNSPVADSPATQTAEDKTVAIVAYLTLIGFIAAIVIHSNKKTKLGAFHLRQMLGLTLSYICAGILAIIPILGWIACIVLVIALFVFWIMGLISAINGQMKPVPILGERFQQWFGNTFD